MSKQQENILPKFIRTKHLLLEPNATREDLIASQEEMDALLVHDNVFIEEKIDAANVGITIYDGQPLIRNRNNILNKAYSRARTPAKMQFAPIWNWFYENAEKFHDMEKALGFMPCVYGEWMYAKHTVNYDQLPNLFVAFDLYDSYHRKFVSPAIYRDLFGEVGISVVPALHVGKVSEELFLKLRMMKSLFSSTDNVEGIYIKTADEEGFINGRYKMVRPDFVQGEHWNKRLITKNKVV